MKRGNQPAGETVTSRAGQRALPAQRHPDRPARQGEREGERRGAGREQ